MKVKYLFSSPEGDIEIDDHIMGIPLKLSIDKEHSWLKLKDYFDLISSFALKRLSKNRIKSLIVRSEKHGAYYHVASVETVNTEGEKKKFAVLVGMSDSGLHLRKEYRLIRRLRKRESGKRFLPEYFIMEEVGVKEERICLVLAEWLDGYYEWHITGDGDVLIWDMDNGYHLASPEQRLSMYERSAYILTCFFDPATFYHIYPWHHSAGDFVVKFKNGVGMKLTSVRDYRAMVKPNMQYDIALITSLVYFFLNMSIKMRLDKENGIGKVLFAPDDIMGSIIKGFFSGMDELISKDLLDQSYKDHIRDFLTSLSQSELARLFHSMLEYYNKEDPSDMSVIMENMQDHITSLAQILPEYLL